MVGRIFSITSGERKIIRFGDFIFISRNGDWRISRGAGQESRC